MTAGLIGHQGYVQWFRSTYLTLLPIWPQAPRAVVVGINPAPKSVAAGHYYQGPLGQKALSRLIAAGVVSAPSVGVAMDDHAAAQGIAFTDVVPRPTPNALALQREELSLGAVRLRQEIEVQRPGLVICVFKPPVRALLGKSAGGPGLQEERFAGIPVFKLAGPFAAETSVSRNVAELSTVWSDVNR